MLATLLISLLISLLSTLTASQLLLTNAACLRVGYPQCFCTCYAPLVLSYCPQDLAVCPCKSTRLLDDLTTCVSLGCTPGEIQGARAIAVRDCSSVGVSLPTNVLVTTTPTVATTATGATGTAAGSGGASRGDGKKVGLGTGAIAGVVAVVVGGIAGAII